MDVIRTKIAAGGRIVIPAEYRRALGLQEGDEVILFLEDGEIRVISPEMAIQRAQQLVASYVTEGQSLAGELIAERREEAIRE